MDEANQSEIVSILTSLCGYLPEEPVIPPTEPEIKEENLPHVSQPNSPEEKNPQQEYTKAKQNLTNTLIASQGLFYTGQNAYTKKCCHTDK